MRGNVQITIHATRGAGTVSVDRGKLAPPGPQGSPQAVRRAADRGDSGGRKLSPDRSRNSNPGTGDPPCRDFYWVAPIRTPVSAPLAPDAVRRPRGDCRSPH